MKTEGCVSYSDKFYLVFIGLSKEELRGQGEIYAEAIGQIEAECLEHASESNDRLRQTIEVLTVKVMAIIYTDVRHTLMTNVERPRPIQAQPRFEKEQAQSLALAA